LFASEKDAAAACLALAAAMLLMQWVDPGAAMTWDDYPNLRRRPHAPARGRGRRGKAWHRNQNHIGSHLS